MKVQTKRTVGALLSAFTLCGLAMAQPNIDFFDDFSTPGLPGRLFVPPESVDDARPVILFLHGAGETGTNNTAQVNGNINNLLDEAQERGAFILAPQTPTFGWTSQNRTDQVMSMLDEVMLQHNADPNRVYITGLSMGGGGSWAMSARYSDRFAASVPICGVNAGGGFQPANLVDMPTWAFHARNDGVVSVNETRNRVNEILTAAGEPTVSFPNSGNFEYASDNLDLSYTEWATGGHNIWGQVYDSPDMYDWMFAKSIPEPASLTIFFGAFASLMILRRPKRLFLS